MKIAAETADLSPRIRRSLARRIKQVEDALKQERPDIAQLRKWQSELHAEMVELPAGDPEKGQLSIRLATLAKALEIQQAKEADLKVLAKHLRGIAHELKEKNVVSRDEAAAQLHAIADELASGNDIVMERDRLRFVARVPDKVELKLEFEVEDDGSEFEIELSW